MEINLTPINQMLTAVIKRYFTLGMQVSRRKRIQTISIMAANQIRTMRNNIG